MFSGGNGFSNSLHGGKTKGKMNFCLCHASQQGCMIPQSLGKLDKHQCLTKIRAKQVKSGFRYVMHLFTVKHFKNEDSFIRYT